MFISKKQKICLFAIDRNTFAILANKFVGNIIQVNTIYIYFL